MIDNKLSISLKQQGLIDMCSTVLTSPKDIMLRSTVIPSSTNSAPTTNGLTRHQSLKIVQPHYQWTQLGSKTSMPPLVPDDLAKKMQINYRAGVGEIIWAMSRPNIAFASVKLSQANSMPHEHHYHGLKHTSNIFTLLATIAYTTGVHNRRQPPRRTTSYDK